MSEQKRNLWKGIGSKWWILLIIFCVGGGWALSSLAPSPAQKAFAWFDKLGFPDVKGRKYVKVSTGGYSQSGSDPPHRYYVEGFLLSESNGTFTVFKNDLSGQTFQKTSSNTPAYKAVGFEVLDLKSNAMAHLTTSNVLYGIQIFPGRRISDDFFLGWACERNGLHGLAEELYRKAAGKRNQPLPLNVRTWWDIRNYAESLIERWKKPPFIHELENEIGERMMWRAMLAFQEPQTSRAELLRKFKEIVQKYPHCQHVSEAKEKISILRQMLKEDEAHARNAVEAQADLSKEERITELIFQLREQNGRQWSDPGSCNIFADPRGEHSPASQLVKLRYDAVPGLIEAVENKDFSRSVGWGRSFYYSHYVLSVGDCAIDILDRIAGRDFRRTARAKTNGSNEKFYSVAKETAQAWWEEFKQKGERVMLIEGTERGNGDSPTQAALLMTNYPDASEMAVVRGARQSTNSWVRSQLIELSTNTPFLLDEVVHGLSLDSRLAAAKQLQRQNLPDAVKAMIEEWKNLKPKASEDESWRLDDLAQFLASSGSVKAIEAMGNDLKGRPVSQRLAVIEAMGSDRYEWNSHSVPELPDGRSQIADEPEEVAEAIERLLAKELEDTERYMGFGGSWDDKSFNNPRMCELAAHMLWKRWPQKYAFDLNAPEEERERKRMECLTVWRERKGE